MAISQWCTLVILAPLIYLAVNAVILYYFLDAIPIPSLAETELHDVLVTFNSSCGSNCIAGSRSFLFGVATAPAHVEDELNDSWLEFAKRGTNDVSDRGPVRAFHNVAIPDERLRFWTDPTSELDLVSGLGAEAFRMGIDWSRLVPQEPISGTRAVVDRDAVQRYRAIMAQVKARNLHLMLTLFHHSLPTWAHHLGGWLNPIVEDYFLQFVRLAMEEFGDLVDYWCTFNEPTIFVILTHCAGAWPPGKTPSFLQSALCMAPFGEYSRAMAAIARAHNKAYLILRGQAPVGVAHNVGWQRAYSLADVPAVLYTDWLMLFGWTDQIQGHLDYLGLNYYGQEFVSVVGLQLVGSEEYSEAGRAVYPDGLFRLLVAFHRRYSAAHPSLRFIVTENGMADSADILRRPYLLEHLLAMAAAIQAGVPVDAYFHWTVSDNWEWADGYCPRFGLVDVERANNLTRRPRPSYFLFKEVIARRQISKQQRDVAWGTLQKEAQSGGLRPFCRAVDPAGRMWADSLDTPSTRPICSTDWRFGVYREPSVGTSLHRVLKVIWTVGFDVIHVLSKWTAVAPTNAIGGGEL